MPITAAHVDTAKERLILARATHLDSLASKLNEPRVRKVIEPMIAGTLPDVDAVYDDDVAYVRDLGLVAQGSPVRIANPIYREVIVRVLGGRRRGRSPRAPGTSCCPTGGWTSGCCWSSSPRSGRGRGDPGRRGVLPRIRRRNWSSWPTCNASSTAAATSAASTASAGAGSTCRSASPTAIRKEQREGIELKVGARDVPTRSRKASAKLDEYLARLGLDTGTLIIFDRRPDAAPIYERTQLTAATTSGRDITLLRA